jgi:hypothetical protein
MLMISAMLFLSPAIPPAMSQSSMADCGAVRPSVTACCLSNARRLLPAT